MASLDIAHQRLHTQHISGTKFERPKDVVRWLGAVQAQDYPAAQWALGLRLHDARVADVEQAFTDGTILRTHVMRPTWHFVTPDDIRWLLALTAPRVHAANAYYYRKLVLDNALSARSNAIIAKALEGKQLTRTELGAILQKAGINTQDLLRLGYIIHRAELDGIVCSGPRRGKQFTYALLDECAPTANTLEHDEALAELTRRYFTGHGPATLKDYVWWSGLSTADAKAGIEMVRSQLVHEVINGQSYWLAESAPFAKDTSPTAYLLPNYDEYSIGYADRSAIFDESRYAKGDPQDNIYFGHMIVIDGQIVGAWKRTFSKAAVVVAAQTFTRLTDRESQALAAAASRYGAFLDMPIVLS
jgi:hypothetical protein